MKHLIIQLASQNSSWPYLTTGTVEELYRSVGIHSEESGDTALISRNFLATKVKKLDGVPGNMLNRADFFDLLIRVARAKYYDVGQQRTDFDSARKSATSIEDSLAELAHGVEKMVNQMTTRFAYLPWQEFRDNELWSFEVDAVDSKS